MLVTQLLNTISMPAVFRHHVWQALRSAYYCDSASTFLVR